MENSKTEKLIRMSEVLELIPVSKSTFYAKIKTGEFPAPIRLSANIVAFKSSDIDYLIENGVEADNGSS